MYTLTNILLLLVLTTPITGFIYPVTPHRSPFVTFSSDAAVFMTTALPSPTSQQQLNLSNAEDNNSALSTFRECELSGLKLMQEGRFDEALDVFQKGMKMDGSRMDVIRTKNLSGPSPVGGSAGGTQAREVRSLDEFELQAGHYNMACAHARLGNSEESVENLRKAWENGFDNVPTIKSDPDLRSVQGTDCFNLFLNEIQPKRNGIFNPFSLFGK